jgi:hypothetical protein
VAGESSRRDFFGAACGMHYNQESLGPSSHVRNTFVVISQKLAIATTAKQVIYFPELTSVSLRGLVS